MLCVLVVSLKSFLLQNHKYDFGFLHFLFASEIPAYLVPYPLLYCVRPPTIFSPMSSTSFLNNSRWAVHLLATVLYLHGAPGSPKSMSLSWGVCSVPLLDFPVAIPGPHSFIIMGVWYFLPFFGQEEHFCSSSKRIQLLIGSILLYI